MFFPFYRGFYIFLMGFQHVHGGSETWGPIGTRHGLQGLFTGLLEAKAVGPEWVKRARENDDEPSGFIS